MYTLRPATQADFPAIRALVRTVGINPMDLDWQRFIVATNQQGELIGCGQVKSHYDGSRELASIAVIPAWRGQGVAREIIETLIQNHANGDPVSGETGDELYLTCRAPLEPLYDRFGFHTIGKAEMPPYFRRVYHLFRILQTLRVIGDGLLVMKRGT